MRDKLVTKSQSYLWVALTIAMLFVLWVQLPRILDPYAIEEDLRNLNYLQRQTNPELYPTFDFAEFRVIDVSLGSKILIIETSSPGFSLLYQLGSIFFSPILFSKLLAFPLMFAAIFFIHRIGERLGGEGMALALSLTFTILIITSTSEISILSGLHRAFALPILLGLIYFLLEKKYRWAMMMLFLNGIFYLPTFPVALMTFAFCLVNLRENERYRVRIHWRPLFEFLVVVLLVIIAVSPTILFQLDGAQEATSPNVTNEEQHLLDDPQYQKGGRRPLFIITPIIGRGGLTTSAQDGFHLMLLLFFAIMILLIRRSKITRPPSVLMKMLYASFLGFFLAWISIFLTNSFLLYLPSRHTRIGLFLFLLIFVVINIQETLRIAVGWVMDRRQQLIWYLLPLLLVVLGLVFLLPDSEESERLDFRGPVVSALLIGLTVLLFGLVLIVHKRRQQEPVVVMKEKNVALPSRLNWLILGFVLLVGSLFYVGFMLNDLHSPEEEAVQLFEYVETLPIDVLIAGSPCALDGVPFYGKRMVLFSCERYLPDQQMILDELEAYYADKGEQIYAFCREYGVTHLVVDEETLLPEYVSEGDYFFEPFNSILAPELRHRTKFVLNHVPEEQKLFQVGSIFIVSCDSSLIELSVDG